MYLMGHSNSSQMLYDLQQDITETFTKRSPDTTGLDTTESLADSIASFNLVNHFNGFLVLGSVILVLAM